MKYFFDTSVLLATVLVQHPHHERSLALYARADRDSACCATHTLAEVYASITRLPGNQRMSPEQALLFLDDIRKRLTTIALDENDYYRAISIAAAEGVTGGRLYDLLLAYSGLKAKAAAIYTWNLNDFQRLGSEVAKRVRTP